jgi:hypothetical protein
MSHLVYDGEIAGEFKGWTGETLYELRNGQMWQQSSYKYEYKYAYMPNALVYEVNGGFKMSVAGTMADVKRVR